MPFFEQPYDWNVMTGCQVCGLDYESPEWIEAVVPNDVWAKISPTGDGDGILCITCIARRCAVLGLDGVPVKLAAGVFDQQPYLGVSGEQLIAALRKQVATLTAERDALEGEVNRNAKTGIALLELLAVSMKESRMTEVHNGYGQIAVLSDSGIAIKGLGSIISGAEKKVVY